MRAFSGWRLVGYEGGGGQFIPVGQHPFEGVFHGYQSHAKLAAHPVHQPVEMLVAEGMVDNV